MIAVRERILGLLDWETMLLFLRPDICPETNIQSAATRSRP